MSEENIQPASEAVSNENLAAPSTTESTAVTNEGNFLDTISTDYKGIVESKGFNSVDDVMKSYTNLEKLVGNSIRIPSEDASAEAKAEFYGKLKGLDGVIVKPNSEAEMGDFYTQLGRPESVEGYKFDEAMSHDTITNIPELTDEVNDFKNMAFELGLNNQQAEALVTMRLDQIKDQEAQLVVQRQEGEKKLQEVWGRDYDNRLNVAKQTAQIYSDKYPDAMSELINGPAGNNPAFLSMLAELGSSFKEKGHIGMQTAKFGTTPEEAQAKIAEKRSDPGFMKAYKDRFDPKHKMAVAELSKLYEIANGR